MKNSRKENIVRRTLDTNRPVELEPAQLARLSALAKKPDEEIDVSDLPPLTDEQLMRMVRANPNYRPNKTPTSFRLDSDVVAWLKSSGKGWQTRTNDILRCLMLAGISPCEQDLRKHLDGPAVP